MRRKISTLIPVLMVLLQLSMQSCTRSKESKLGKNKFEDVVAAMTSEEKVDLVCGADTSIVQGAAGTTCNLNRFGIPSTVLADGPQSVNISVNPKSLAGKNGTKSSTGIYLDNSSGTDSSLRYATAFPSSSALAATWNIEMARQVGSALGNEALEFNIDVLLAPGMNTQRNPSCGRNFEYFSEDPQVSGTMASAVVKGIQSNGIGATLKCLTAYNQETNRKNINCIVSQRALREIYLRGFEIAVKESQPWCIMTAYNRINGHYAAENGELLTIVLRNEWGFKGMVMTDWGNLGDPVAKMYAGNDLLMSGSKEERKALMWALKNKTLDEKVLNVNVTRILQMIEKTPKFRNYKPSNMPNSALHAKLAREAADEGLVLLKNNNETLPFNPKIKTIALFSKGSYYFVASGTGSGESHPLHSVSVNEGMKNAGFQIVKYLDDIYSNFVDTILANNSKVSDYFKRRIVPFHSELSMSKAILAQQTAASDIAVITIGRTGGEGHDNGYIPLDEVEQNLVRDVCDVYHAAGKKVVVVLNVGGAFETASWRDLPDAILLAWQTGEQGGNAVVDVLKGDVNPSGKLPVSFPVKYEDVPSAKSFAIEPESQKVVNINPSFYDEGIYVGYRYYDSFKVPVAYEFGYGLSYTSFEYSDLKLSNQTFIDKLKVSLKVKNTGKVSGKEVVQLYLSAPNTEIKKPVQELKGFAKTKLLQPGESQQLTFELDARSLASFWSGISAWVADNGDYQVRIGASSKDIRLKASFTLPKDIVVEKVHDVMYPNFAMKEFNRNSK